MPEHVTIPAPHVPFPGGRTDAAFMRSAADHLERGYAVGGRNVTETVIRLLRDVAVALDAAAKPQAWREGDRIRHANGMGYGDQVPDAMIEEHIAHSEQVIEGGGAPGSFVKELAREHIAFARAVLALRRQERAASDDAACPCLHADRLVDHAGHCCLANWRTLGCHPVKGATALDEAPAGELS